MIDRILTIGLCRVSVSKFVSSGWSVVFERGNKVSKLTSKVLSSLGAGILFINPSSPLP
jgi:hypothetical protein